MVLDPALIQGLLSQSLDSLTAFVPVSLHN